MSDDDEWAVLLPQFEKERKAEDERLSQLERARISPWNPRTTMQWDHDRAKKRVADLKRWCEAWWLLRGFVVVWQNDANEYQLPSADLKRSEPQQQTSPRV